MRKVRTLFLAAAAASIAPIAIADTTDVKSQSIVEVTKKGAHCEQDPNCFNRYHPAIKPVARVPKSGAAMPSELAWTPIWLCPDLSAFRLSI